MSDLSDEQIIKRMAEIEGKTEYDINPSGAAMQIEGIRPYNPLRLSEAGRLIEKYTVDLVWLPGSKVWEAEIDFKEERRDPSLMRAICLAIIIGSTS